jgi:hypothetical protein
MSRPWTLPGAEYRKEIKVSNTPAVDDFATIKANMERIKREECVPQTETAPAKVTETDGDGIVWDYGCNGTSVEPHDSLTTYEHMELLLDENDEIIGKYFPDPRIQKLIDKYGLKLA